MNCRRFFFKCKRKGFMSMMLILIMAFTYVAVPINVIYSKENDVELIDIPVNAADLGITSKSCVLMEASTGTVLYDKAKDERLSPASITKIMTLLLIFEEIEKGKITLDEEVITSAYAKSMGGSQVFLEEGEK